MHSPTCVRHRTGRLSLRAFAAGTVAGATASLWADPPIVVPDPTPDPPASIGTSILLTKDVLLAGCADKRSPDGAYLSSRGGVLLWPRALAGSMAGVPLPPPTLLLAPSLTRAERFGEAMAIDGSALVVGGPGFHTSASLWGVGRVHRYVWNGATRPATWLEPINPPVPANGLEFGSAVDVDGSLIAIAAPGYRAATSDPPRGIVYLVEANGSSVTFTGELVGPVPNARFGSAVAITSGGIAVGAPGCMASEPTDEGSVVLFDTAPPHAIVATLMAPEPSLGNRFGATMVTNGSLLAVGAPGAACDTGEVHLFRHGPKGWSFEATLVAPGGGNDPAWTGFGNALAIDRERLAVGTGGLNNDDAIGYKVAVFRRSGSTWITEAIGGGTSADPGGGAVALDPACLVSTQPNVGQGVLFYEALPRSADIDFDGHVGPGDLAILLGAWAAAAPTSPADLNGDGAVDAIDLSILIGAWQ